MTTILFIRHGESETNKFIHQDPNDPHLSDKINAVGDPHLTENGILQAKQVGEYLITILKDKKVRVLTSLFTRTIETSQPFCDEYKSNVSENESLEILSEYTKPQKKLTDEHLKKGLRNHIDWYDFTVSIEECVDILEDMAQCNNQPIIVFGHSLYISTLISYLGSSKMFMPEKSQLIFRFPNCSITSCEYSQGSWRIFNVASIAHLTHDVITGTECPFGNIPNKEDVIYV